ncbi:hypothetical protein LV779_37315 [Streptomyces thinghirensis]|nr:hypothetical protein [Streptomyces thinghirensis]
MKAPKPPRGAARHRSPPPRAARPDHHGLDSALRPGLANRAGMNTS